LQIARTTSKDLLVAERRRAVHDPAKFRSVAALVEDGEDREHKLGLVDPTQVRRLSSRSGHGRRL
jgi:hypothetical protein